MKVLFIILGVVLAAAVWGLVLLRRPLTACDSIEAVPAQAVYETEAVFQALEIPEQPEYTVISVNETIAEMPAEVEETAPESAPSNPSFQTLEERGDAMLFEAEALSVTPFDQAILAPFYDL